MNLRLSHNQRELLLLAHRNGPVLQSTALSAVYGLPPEGKLRKRPGRYYSAQRLGPRYNVVRTSLTRSLRRLERDGLVFRTPGKAGRASFRLTESGTEVATSLAMEERTHASNQVQARPAFHGAAR